MELEAITAKATDDDKAGNDAPAAFDVKGSSASLEMYYQWLSPSSPALMQYYYFWLRQLFAAICYPFLNGF